MLVFSKISEPKLDFERIKAHQRYVLYHIVPCTNQIENKHDLSVVPKKMNNNWMTINSEVDNCSSEKSESNNEIDVIGNNFF